MFFLFFFRKIVSNEIYGRLGIIHILLLFLKLKDYLEGSLDDLVENGVALRTECSELVT
jgi:hypothetical protein